MDTFTDLHLTNDQCDILAHALRATYLFDGYELSGDDGPAVANLLVLLGEADPRDDLDSFPAPELGTDEVIYSPDDDDYGYGPWVAMDNRSVGTRFPTESEALTYWSLVHSKMAS